MVWEVLQLNLTNNILSNGLGGVEWHTLLSRRDWVRRQEVESDTGQLATDDSSRWVGRDPGWGGVVEATCLKYSLVFCTSEAGGLGVSLVGAGGGMWVGDIITL